MGDNEYCLTYRTSKQRETFKLARDPKYFGGTFQPCQFRRIFTWWISNRVWLMGQHRLSVGCRQVIPLGSLSRDTPALSVLSHLHPMDFDHLVGWLVQMLRYHCCFHHGKGRFDHFTKYRTVWILVYWNSFFFILAVFKSYYIYSVMLDIRIVIAMFTSRWYHWNMITIRASRGINKS